MTWLKLCDRSKLLDAWDRFLFRPIPAYSLALFRIAFASVVVLNLLLLAPDTFTWFGQDGVLPIEYLPRVLVGSRVNVLLLLPQSDALVACFLGLTFMAALSLLVGWQTRAASIVLWLCLVSLHHRNIYILNSGDTLMRNLSFFLMFAPAGKAYSVDRYLRIRRGIEESGVPLIAPWSQRLLQIQVCVMYFSTVMWKLSGTAWLDGTAVYYIMQLDEFKRFPVPALMQSLWFSRITTWSSLAVEAAMATLVWFRPLRKPVLLGGIMLHLGLEYTMNIPVFQWMVLASYLLFFDVPSSATNRPKRFEASLLKVTKRCVPRERKNEREQAVVRGDKGR